MSRRRWTLTEEPRGEHYRRLVEWAVRESGRLLLVVRDLRELDSNAQRVLRRLGPDLLRHEESSRWPGTELFGRTAIVHSYRCSKLVRLVLAEEAGGLYGWRVPSLPEDPCFLAADGESRLVTIAHERDAYFEMSADEHRALLEALPELRELTTLDE